MFNLRRAFIIDPTVTFLNHGSFGATSRRVFRVYQDWQKQLEQQPVEFLGRRFRELMAESRSYLGKYLGTAGANLVYTTNVTESINIVARSLCLGPDDEVLASNHEYGALDRTWLFLSREFGFRYKSQNITVPIVSEETFMDELWQGITKHTRVLFLSHITSPTALLFPVEAVINRARAEGIITVVDGAHGPGQIPLVLDELGVDFYGGNLHKWLCAPKGAGFLYARPGVQHLLKPLIVSWGYEAEIPGTSLFIDHHEWTGTRDIAAFLSVPAAIDFQYMHNWEKVRFLCRSLINDTQKEICSLTGIQALNRQPSSLQMVSVPLPESVDIVRLKSYLYEEHRIEVPVISWNGRKLIRVSIQAYNTHQDIQKLLYALEDYGLGITK